MECVLWVNVLICYYLMFYHARQSEFIIESELLEHANSLVDAESVTCPCCSGQF